MVAAVVGLGGVGGLGGAAGCVRTRRTPDGTLVIQQGAGTALRINGLATLAGHLEIQLAPGAVLLEGFALSDETEDRKSVV